jgi:hypothetical protein
LFIVLSLDLSFNAAARAEVARDFSFVNDAAPLVRGQGISRSMIGKMNGCLLPSLRFLPTLA